MASKPRCGALVAILAAACGAVATAQSVPQAGANPLSATMRAPRMAEGLGKPLNALPAAFHASAGSQNAPLAISTHNFPPGSIQLPQTLPLWTFNMQGSRDGDNHQGVMVGRDPFRNPGTSRIPTYIVPLIIRTHTVATGYDFTTGNYSTAPGVTTIDPTRPNDSCLAKPNDIPTRVFEQSPIFNPAPFVFGGTHVGTTQYVDAYQRANFWAALGNGSEDYHVLLQPVTTLAPIVIDVPASVGLAVGGDVYGNGFSFCGPQALVDLLWFDSYVRGTVFPALTASGVTPDTLAILLTSNTAWSVYDVNNLFYCCAVGYHTSTGAPIYVQTYAAVDFDTSGFFQGPRTGLSTSTAAHEVAEWMNDPLAANYTAPWGNVAAYVGGCSQLLEVGDALGDSDVAPVTMPNGFTYSLQELVFFSWFLGGPSIGVNGWYSNNGTFTTDAGPNCEISAN